VVPWATRLISLYLFDVAFKTFCFILVIEWFSVAVVVSVLDSDYAVVQYLLFLGLSVSLCSFRHIFD
jgi:hypothetical protein